MKIPVIRFTQVLAYAGPDKNIYLLIFPPGYDYGLVPSIAGSDLDREISCKPRN